MSILENLTQPVIYAVAWTIIHSLWQFTIILGLWYGIIRLNKNGTATYKYNVSLTALLTLIVTALITFFKEYKLFSSASKLAAINIPEQGWMTTGDASPFYVVNNSSFLDRIISEETLPALFWIYLLGLIFVSSLNLINYYQLTRLTKTSRPAQDDDLLIMVRKLTIDTGMLKQVGVRISAYVSIPAVIGFFKPFIILPASMLTCLSPSQIESIILHELYHIRRNDHFINILQQIFEIALFYHPAVWVINKAMRQERENCVDEWVVAKTKEPHHYASALLRLEESRQHQNKWAIAANQSKFHLLTRINNIMTMKTQQSNSAPKVAGILLLMTALLSIAWMNPAISINSKADSQFTETNSENIILASDTIRKTVTIAEPTSIQLEEGKVIAWDSLSEENKAQIREAIKDARIALKEVRSELNSEEFRQDMREARKDMKEAQIEISGQLEYFKSEEFAQEMREARKEIKKAMEQMNIEIKTELESAEFRAEMKKVSEEVQKSLAETGVVLEDLGPFLQETLSTVFEAIQEAELNTESDTIK
jgi:beta-lactamase regulating signal transducer with metallopeptidase domain/Sec-independent protein translocase protein TatA